ncbi:hypothetical protein IF2G_00259 [Cordyceps javanica]|nr:hypothetical protein IF2G_00259 [Cordyceps javanica]
MWTWSCRTWGRNRGTMQSLSLSMYCYDQCCDTCTITMIVLHCRIRRTTQIRDDKDRKIDSQHVKLRVLKPDIIRDFSEKVLGGTMQTRREYRVGL